MTGRAPYKLIKVRVDRDPASSVILHLEVWMESHSTPFPKFNCSLISARRVSLKIMLRESSWVEGKE